MEPQTPPSNTVVDPTDFLNQVAGKPKEDAIVPPPPKVEEAFYKGLGGEMKTPEDLRNYTKGLEELLVNARASQTAPIPTTNHTAPIIPQTGAKERFSELIFNKPDEAFELAVSEAERRTQQKIDAEQAKSSFWKTFYDKNPDLQKNRRAVELIFREKEHEVKDVRRFPSSESLEEFLAKETRGFLTETKKGFGAQETTLPSGSAVTLGASGEPVQRTEHAPAAPLNFADQIRKLRKKG